MSEFDLEQPLEQPKISIGARVVRGKEWKWEDIDGNGGMGTVTDISSLRGWVQVKWDCNSATGHYRFGLGSYDLYEIDGNGKVKTEPWKEEDYVVAPLHCDLQPASAMQTACQVKFLKWLHQDYLLLIIRDIGVVTNPAGSVIFR